MIRVAHLASYNINAGDNIASYNIRTRLETIIEDKIQWTSINIIPIHEFRNNIERCKSLFKNISNTNDLLLVGGGGLIEFEHKFETGWKLPFNDEILKLVDIPIVAFGVGLNTFRNRDRVSQLGLYNTKRFIEACNMFSVRNDGSQNLVKNYLNMNSLEVPDPGLIFGFETKRKTNISAGFFQPAWNTGTDIVAGRSLFPENIKKLSNVVEKLNLKIIPHTPKDYKFPGIPIDAFCWTEERFKEIIKYENFMEIFNHYFNFDYGIVMRGHGQLCSVGLNVPAIYFSTQDKVLDFSNNNEFQNYNVDIRESDWDKKLLEKADRLKNDEQYLSEWYEIRNRNMQVYEKSFGNYCEKIKNILQN